MRIAFTTLGCKINQYETDLLRQDLQSRGNSVVPFDAEADVYVINTCSVTAKSDYQSRQVIRSAVKRGQRARVIVTGCYASTRPGEIREIPGVQLVVNNADKAGIADQIMKEASASDIATVPAGISIKALQGRTRSFLKIQDGCDNRCTYCIVPSARGGSRSAMTDAVISEFDRLVQAGCPEIVLTGIHIGTYGTDLRDASNLSALVGSLLARRGIARLRLSSIEANEITADLIGFLGKGLCRHLHIPLQSGDDAILSSMKRKYTSECYRHLLETIANEVPGTALGADIIVGFPGEGEKEFRNTLDLVRQSHLTHLHVFSYSARPGTPAAEMKHQVPDRIKKERNEVLRIEGKKKNLEFRKKFLGNALNVVIEDKPYEETELLSGLSDNYIRVSVIGAKKEHIGKEINVKLEEVTDTVSLGTII
jgi:threonylcarbamoyladenosine tRNA methylthiotransferase MtaB